MRLPEFAEYPVIPGELPKAVHEKVVPATLEFRLIVHCCPEHIACDGGTKRMFVTG